MIIYRSCLVYGFREGNEGRVLNWDLLRKNDMDLFFERSESFYASGPYYGIKTDINPNTGYVRRGKALKDAVDEFYKKVCEYCARQGLVVPREPEFACVLEGDLNYNLEMYSLEELKYDGIKSVVYIEVAHSTATEEQLTVFVKEMVSHICAMERMEADDFVIKNYSKSEIEYAESFERLIGLEEAQGTIAQGTIEQGTIEQGTMVDIITNQLSTVSLDNKTMLCFKLIFRHDEPKDAWKFMQKILAIKTHSEEHSWDSLLFNGSYVYVHNRGYRAQIGNVWLPEGTIMDM